MKRFVFLAALVLLPQLALLAADGEQVGRAINGYDPDSQTKPFRTVSAPDSTSYSTVVALTAFRLNGRSNISVSVHFALQNQGQATAPAAGILVIPIFRDSAGVNHFHDVAPVATATLTLNAPTDENGRYCAPAILFDGAGATHVQVLVVGFAGGVGGAGSPVDLWVGSR